jgi:hypothetical protein
MRRKSIMAMNGSARWRGGVAAMLLGALVIALLSSENSLPADAEEKQVALPPDLAKIPSDSMLLCSIRVADLWTGDFLKSVRKKHKEIAQAAGEFEKHFGLALEQVERLTLAIVGPPPASREPVIIVRTVKPYELAKVLATDAKLKRETYKGESLYVADRWAAYPLDNRTLAFSEFASELHNLIDHPRPKEKSALTNALTQAAQRHALLLGVNAKQYFDSSQGDPLPANAEPFRPLFLAHWATLVVDVGAESRLTVTARFANEKDAKAAAKTAESGLALLRGALDQGIEMLGKEKETAEFASLLKQLKQPVKEMQIEQKSEMLQSSLQVKVDPAAAGVVVVEGIQKMREAAARTQSANNLKQLALAMLNYEAATGRFPPQAIFDKNGKPLLSWRVLILPYIEQQNLYKQFHFDEPWDSEHNKKLLDRMPKMFASPQDEKCVKEHVTHYQGFVGKWAFFEGKQGIRIADITDGTSNTIMLAEASKAVPWTKPEDIPFDAEKPLPKLGLAGASYFLAAICDGSVRAISHSITKETLRNAIQRTDGNPLGADW